MLGWKEYELEVMRDRADNFVVVCSIENLDPMGVHTGDSITVAPGADADRPRIPASARPGAAGDARGRRGDGRLERAVRRQPANRPRARHRDEPARLALVGAGVQGHRLPHRQDRRAGRGRLHAGRDHQRHHRARRAAAFEPSLDYVVVKIPRWAFEKFPGVDPTLGPQMKSVGEVMALGRTFPEALQQGRAVAGDRRGCAGWLRPDAGPCPRMRRTLATLAVPTADRLFAVYRALRGGVSIEDDRPQLPATIPGS